eukprot:11171661-Lingulodinium_polyedra.AAC.1
MVLRRLQSGALVALEWLYGGPKIARWWLSSGSAVALQWLYRSSMLALWRRAVSACWFYNRRAASTVAL